MIAGADPARRALGPAFRLVGGKGGVGKTTCAAAIGVTAARSGLRTLVVTTDPAPSLTDVFGVRLGPVPRRVPLRARGALHAVELDAARIVSRWLAGRRDALARIAVRGTWLDADDVDRLLRLTLPGIDEIAALLELARYARSSRFDLIVVDTAPTGHTLRMLSGPELFVRVARVFETMQGRHRAVVAALRGGWTPDSDDEVIASLDADAREVSQLIRDPDRTAVTWVTLPEPMAVSETVDAVEALRTAGIQVRHLFVNRLTPPPGTACAHCAARRAFEARALHGLRSIARHLPLVAIHGAEREPRGITALEHIGRAITAGDRLAPTAGRAPKRWQFRTDGEPVAAAALVGESTRLVMFAGKGGVGKTTCAAAAALAESARRRRTRILLLSTDPAHSLSDVLGTDVGDQLVEVESHGLFVRELDARRRLEQVRTAWAAAVGGVFDRLSRASSVDATPDRRVMSELIDLAPPGMDELIGIAEIAELLDTPPRRGGFGLIVLDMAPSGHALRLLASPPLVQEWARTLMAIQLKYQDIVGIGELGATLLDLSRRLGRLGTLLQDPLRTQVVVVTRAAVLPLAETRRLQAQLAALRIPVTHLLVNAVGRGTCARCRRAATAERRDLAGLRSGWKPRLIVAPTAVPPPASPADLMRWADSWRHPPARRRRPDR